MITGLQSRFQPARTSPPPKTAQQPAADESITHDIRRPAAQAIPGQT
jgi:hypothetical protein